MALNIESLKNAWLSLDNALNRASHAPDDLIIRDACIQRFEYTYELSIKTIKRYIEQEMPIIENIDQLNFRDLIRVAFESGLIQSVEPWFEYRIARNQTSHAYDENKAQAVYQVLPKFLENAKALILEIDKRLT